MFSYDPTLALDRDWVRLMVGDRNPAKYVLEDEEINGLLARERNRYLAAAEAGEAVLAKTQGVVSKQVDDLRITYGSGSKESAYRHHLDKLRQRGIQLSMGVSASFKVL